MTIEQISTLNEIEIINKVNLTLNIESLYIGDLLSVVMANATENQLWLTVQTHINVIAVASLKELGGIVFVEGHEVDEDTLEKAKELKLPLFKTTLSAYELTKKLIISGL